MGDVTGTRSYPYPTSTDDVRPHEDIQALAEAVDADVDDIVRPPLGRIVASGTQALADNTATAVQFSAADEIDTHGQHSPSVNNTRVTPNVAGYYRFDGTAFFNEQATPNNIQTYFRKNGVTNLPPGGRMPGSSTTASSLSTTVIQDMNGSTDYVELMALQDSAGADTTHSSVQLTSVVQWQYLGPSS
jgi:hypothetical protein